MSSGLGLRLARRNLWRNPRRTILTFSAIAFATAILVFMIAFQQGGYRAMIESAIGVFTGHLQVQVAGYHDNPRLSEYFEDASALEARIAKLSGVKAVAARGESYALLSSSSRTHGAAVVGVEPEHEPQLSTLPKSIREGRFLSGNHSDEAVVGMTLAKNLSLSLGDTLTLLGQGNEGSLAAATLTVVGIFQSGEPELDRSTMEMPLGTFQEVFSIPDGAHSIAVRTANLDQVDRVTRSISAALSGRPKLVVLPWQDLLEGLKQGITLDATVGWFLYAVLVFVVTFSILNTFLMAVLERTHEFGVLLALGTRPNYLGRVVMTESIMLLLLGLLVGLGLGCAVTLLTGQHGLAFSGSEELLTRWNLPSRIYPRLNLLSLTVGPAVIFVVTFIAALFPLVRIRRLRPVDAMKAV
ncbi:MAG TPA: ABC transporter permease [Candidatus Krumholzibacteria bacterium]|nr:ABC transporter permease [Candidatus Krumholzibacteria bacterium]